MEFRARRGRSALRSPEGVTAQDRFDRKPVHHAEPSPINVHAYGRDSGKPHIPLQKTDRLANPFFVEGSAMDRTIVSANRPWERIVGYSRAVRVGDHIEVSGTAPAGPGGEILAPGDMYGQARESLRIIGDALAELGGSFTDVVRTRVFLSDASRWEEAGRAHGEVFSEVRPANTIVAVSGFVDSAILVEIEVTAILAAE